MKTLSRFVTKFTSLIVAVLSCFDRVIFKGHLPITNGPALEGFVDHVLKIRRKRLHGLRRGTVRHPGRPRQATGPGGRRRIPLPSRQSIARTSWSMRSSDNDRSSRA